MRGGTCTRPYLRSVVQTSRDKLVESGGGVTSVTPLLFRRDRWSGVDRGAGWLGRVNLTGGQEVAGSDPASPTEKDPLVLRGRSDGTAEAKSLRKVRGLQVATALPWRIDRAVRPRSFCGASPIGPSSPPAHRLFRAPSRLGREPTAFGVGCAPDVPRPRGRQGSLPPCRFP